MFDEYLLRQLTSFVRWIQYLVVEDWKVKRQTQSNGMCGLHFAFTNFKGILVCGLAVIHYGWNFSYHLWLQIPRLWKEGNYKGMRFWVTYCCVFRRLQLQPNICSNRLSFSNRRLCFLDCWLWEWGICPRVPEIQKIFIYSSLDGEELRITHQHFITNFPKLFFNALSVFTGQLLLSGWRFSFLFNWWNHSPWWSTNMYEDLWDFCEDLDWRFDHYLRAPTTFL